MPRVFLSYAQKDVEFVRTLATDLRREGFDVWYDQGIAPGSSWAKNLTEAAEGSQFFLIALSPEYLSAPWVAKEIQMGLHREAEGQTTVIGLMLRVCKTEGVIDVKKHIDFTSSYELALTKLLSILREHGIDEDQERQQRIIKSLEDPNYTWRTVEGICKETSLQKEIVQGILTALSGSIVVRAVQRKTNKELFTTNKHLDNKVPTSDRKLENVAVMISDLVGSTSYKLENGHKKGVERMFLANKLTEGIVLERSGEVLKNLGDGLLCSFRNPLDAMLAALEVNRSVPAHEQCRKLDVALKFSITLGTVEVVSKGGSNDIFGTPVDKCARIVSLAQPSQIIVDEAIYSSCQSNILDHDFSVSQSEKGDLKDFPNISLREIARHKSDFKGIKVTKFPPFVPELSCSKCGKPVSDRDIRDSMITLEFDQETNQNKRPKTIVKDVLILHKGTCNLDSVLGWRDLSDLSSPEGYIEFVFTVVNLIHGKQERWTEEAKKKAFDILLRMYPFVFRKSTTDEFEKYLHNKWLLNYGL